MCDFWRCFLVQAERACSRIWTHSSTRSVTQHSRHHGSCVALISCSAFPSSAFDSHSSAGSTSSNNRSQVTGDTSSGRSATDRSSCPSPCTEKARMRVDDALALTLTRSGMGRAFLHPCRSEFIPTILLVGLKSDLQPTSQGWLDDVQRTSQGTRFFCRSGVSDHNRDGATEALLRELVCRSNGCHYIASSRPFRRDHYARLRGHA